MGNQGIHSQLKELTRRLTGKWRVSGHRIDGKAEYKSLNGGALLVMHVDFIVDGNRIKNIQHISYDPDTDSLRSRYMDTMGNEDTYIWVFAGQKIRISLREKESDTYFEATLNEDNSEYTGLWHYPEGGDQDTEKSRIVYTRIKQERKETKA